MQVIKANDWNLLFQSLVLSLAINSQNKVVSISIAVYWTSCFTPYTSNHIYTQRSKSIFIHSVYGKRTQKYVYIIQKLTILTVSLREITLFNALQSVVLRNIGMIVPFYIMVKAIISIQQFQYQVSSKLNVFVHHHFHKLDVTSKVHSFFSSSSFVQGHQQAHQENEIGHPQLRVIHISESVVNSRVE